MIEGCRRRSRPGVKSRLAAFVLALLVGVPAAAQQDGQRALRLGLILGERAEGDALRTAYLEGAEQGAVMAAEEFALNASLFGIDFSLEIARSAPDELEVTAARLAEEAGVMAVIGGTNEAEARALGAWATEQGVPFVNIGASSDALRNEGCTADMFHLAPSAAMYLDALAGWYVRAGLRRWYFVRFDGDEAEAQYQRALDSIGDRHFAAREVGAAVLGEDGNADEIARVVAGSNADLVVLLAPAATQLELLAALDAQGVEAMVTGFPHPETQIRDFAAASRAAAPRAGTGHRAIAWEPLLDAYGARELNARYMQRWDEPMEFGGWAAYQAVKILFEAATLGGAMDAAGIVGYLGSEAAVFDVWKGIGTSFRPWDNQLRQSLYLVKINEGAAEGLDAALLVGELPAIYMPGTDPVERLDQLGDLEARSRCEK